MNLKKLKVYHYFWITSILILLIGFLRQDSTHSTLDINIHDTYFVIANSHVTILLTSCYFLLGISYWFLQKVLKRKLINSLTLIHSVILLGSILVYWLVYCYSNVIAQNPSPLFDDYQLINQTVVILLLLIIFVGQPVYFVNLLIGLFRKQSTIR